MKLTLIALSLVASAAFSDSYSVWVQPTAAEIVCDKIAADERGKGQETSNGDRCVQAISKAQYFDQNAVHFCSWMSKLGNSKAEHNRTISCLTDIQDKVYSRAELVNCSEKVNYGRKRTMMALSDLNWCLSQKGVSFTSVQPPAPVCNEEQAVANAVASMRSSISLKKNSIQSSLEYMVDCINSHFCTDLQNRYERLLNKINQLDNI